MDKFYLFLDESGTVSERKKAARDFLVVGGIVVGADKYWEWYTKTWLPLVYPFAYDYATRTFSSPVPWLTKAGLFSLLYVHSDTFFTSHLSDYWKKWFPDAVALHSFQRRVLKAILDLDFLLFISYQDSQNAFQMKSHQDLIPSYVWCSSFVIERAAWNVSSFYGKRSNDPPLAKVLIAPEYLSSYASSEDSSNAWKALPNKTDIADYLAQIKTGKQILPFYKKKILDLKNDNNFNDTLYIDEKRAYWVSCSVASANWLEENISITFKEDHVAGSQLIDLLVSAALKYGNLGAHGNLKVAYVPAREAKDWVVPTLLQEIYDRKIVRSHKGQSGFGLIKVEWNFEVDS